jgi:two-component system cell cycle sensor histidine kinase/response regulator CckA
MGAKGKSRNNQVEILIVEDSPTQAQQLRYFLEQHDFQISLAGNGKEALALLAKHKQEIVISDIIMPEMDGYELCRQIKADERLKNIPVILVTRLSEPRDVIRGLECGADNFITKPYDEKFLLSRIQYLILNRELRKREDVQMAIQVSFAGEKYNITSDRLQILNLLLSTYEVALQKNMELTTAHNELRRLNERLEELVKERTAALNERVKELHCLYAISIMTQMPDSSVKEVVQNAVNLLPSGWLYPEVACARILLEGQEFKTENFRETGWRQSSPILLDGEQRAMVEVYYLEEKPECDEGPFLKEERGLIDDVARQLGGFIERKYALERLQHLNQVLRAIRKINQLITQESDRDRLIQDVCEGLISTRGYYSAWIALMDRSGKIVFCAEAGIGQDFLPLKEQLDRGELPICGRKALEQSGVVIAEDPATSCTDCPLTHWYGDKSAFTCRLEHGGTIYGLLTVSGPLSLVTDEEEIKLLEEVTADIALGLSNIKKEEERKEAEEALEESEKRFRELYDEAPVGYFEYDSQGRITNVNRTELEMLGYTHEEMIGQPAWKCIVEKEEARQQILAKLAGTMPPARGLDRTYRRKDGTTFPAMVEDRLILDSGEKIKGIRATIQDITERKQSEEVLKQAEEKYRDIFENAIEGIFQATPEGRYINVNPALAHMYGYDSPEELMNTVKDIYHQLYVNPNRHSELLRLLEEKGVVHNFEIQVYHKDREIIWISTNIRVVHDNDGRFLYYEGAVQNMTEQKKAEKDVKFLEDQLRQSQKLESIGRLAGGVAHDFNNLLTIIKGNSQLSLMDLKEEDPLRENLEEVVRASDRASDLIRQLLAFSRRQILEMRVLDLNTVLRDMDKMLHRLIGEDIELITLLADDLGRVKTDPGWVEQIIMNLAVNARDAMPSVGKLTIETANVELDEAYARNHIAVTPGRYVMLSMSDTGVGMTPEVRQQVFEPFFTTKEKGKGTGLGLSTVYGIVKQSGGNIWVYSEPDKGTTFKIYLPRVDEPLEELGERAEVKEVPRGTETILICEDEEDVLKLAGRILSGQGYTVLQASSTSKALEICKEQTQPIHLILTDVVMPQMSGRELLEQCRKVRVDFKILYMSGYTDYAITHHGVLEKGVNYIQKPFTVDGLARKVRAVLDK